MESESLPAELLSVREKIDELDHELIKLLARRFELTHQVGKLKASHALEALDSSRETEKLERIRALCEHNALNPDLVADLFCRIMEEVVRNHKRLREA